MVLYSYNNHYLAVKRNELLIYTTCMSFHTIILSERSQGKKKKNAFCMIPFIENSRKYNLIQSDRKQVSCCLRDESRVTRSRREEIHGK